jgi:peptidoglycan/LPS O-acetylase OafA/YrhL
MSALQESALERPMEKDHRFIPSLETLRGLAALTVCLTHACDINVNGAPLLSRSSWSRFLFNGHGPVVVFFVLSGFVLRLSLTNKWKQPIPNVAAGFAVARLFRLYPVVIATVLLFVGGGWIFSGQTTSFDTVLRNASLLDVSVNGALWTVQVEVFGSALVLCAFLLERLTSLWAVVGLTGLLFPFSFLGQSSVLGRPLFGLLYPFLCGYIVAAHPQISIRLAPKGNTLLVFALAVFYLAGTIGFVLKQWLLLLTTISATLIIAVLAAQRYRGALQWGPVRFLGTVSYSFYALHPLGLIAAAFVAQSLSDRSTPRVAIVAATFVICVFVALLLGACLHYAVERPAMKIGNRLGRLLIYRGQTPSTMRPTASQPNRSISQKNRNAGTDANSRYR